MSQQVLKKRENALLQRAAYMRRLADVIDGFSKCGFGSYTAVLALYKQYYTDSENNIFNFWNLKKMDPEIMGHMECILEKLKSE